MQFPLPPLSPLTPLDIALMLGLALALPLHLYFAHKREKKREAEGRERTRMQRYRGAIALILTMGLVTVAVWVASGRSFTELGFTADGSLFFFGGLAIVFAACGALIAQAIVITHNDKAKAELTRELDANPAVAKFTPHTIAELRMFALVSLTAGVFEEIVFRGFLIWALAHWIPLWAAAIASIAVFTLSHLYQESLGALLRVLGMAIVVTLVVVFSGSLYPAILLHAAVDLSSGYITWQARRDRNVAPAD